MKLLTIEQEQRIVLITIVMFATVLDVALEVIRLFS
jgi:hypothetical protein